MGLEVIEYTDPLCPWAWGAQPKFEELRVRLGAAVPWRRCFGILFDDSDDPAPDPVAETRWYERHLASIATHTGAEYPAVLERVARSSRPATLAVIAAGEQSAELGDAVLWRLRETLFRTGHPPDTSARVRACVADVPGLDVPRLVDAAASGRVRERLERDRAEARSPVPALDTVDDSGPHPGRAKELDDGRRYAFPTLLFTAGERRIVVAGWRPMQAYLDAVAALA
jgi:protein-disulfide isomerase-like protein with CxxC motif